MSQMTLQEFKEVSGDHHHYNLKAAISKFIDENKVVVFYPKNLFLEDKRLEIHLFMDNQVISLFYRGNDIQVKVNKYENIKYTELIYQGKFGSTLLTIIFDNEFDISLDYMKDTNHIWNDQFAAKIEKIFKLISK